MQGNVLSCRSLVRWFRNVLQGRLGACSLCLPFSHVHDRRPVIFSVLAINPLKPRNRHASPFYSLNTNTSTPISILESYHARQHQAPRGKWLILPRGRRGRRPENLHPHTKWRRIREGVGKGYSRRHPSMAYCMNAGYTWNDRGVRQQIDQCWRCTLRKRDVDAGAAIGNCGRQISNFHNWLSEFDSDEAPPLTTTPPR